VPLFSRGELGRTIQRAAVTGLLETGRSRSHREHFLLFDAGVVSTALVHPYPWHAPAAYPFHAKFFGRKLSRSVTSWMSKNFAVVINVGAANRAIDSLPSSAFRAYGIRRSGLRGRYRARLNRHRPNLALDKCTACGSREVGAVAVRETRRGRHLGRRLSGSARPPPLVERCVRAPVR